VLCGLVFLACEQPGPKDPSGENPATEDSGPKITGIEIIQPANITFFARNQPFSHEGLELRYTLDTGEYGDKLVPGDYTVGAVDTSTPRSDVVTVTARTKDGVFTARYGIYIDNSSSILGSVRLESPPSKTAYSLGDAFSKTGMKVSGTYQGGDRDGETVSVDASGVTVYGYDRRRRGSQRVTLKVNGLTLADLDVTVRVPAGAVVTVNAPFNATYDHQNGDYKTTYIKGMAFDASGLKAAVQVNGQTIALSAAGGDIKPGDISGFDRNASGGKQTLTLTLDDASATFEVYLADLAPHVYFDYGFMRTELDPLGVLPGGGYTDSNRTAGRRYAAVNEKLVLAPVRYLIGYDADNKDLSVTCVWSVSGPSTYRSSSSGEFFDFTPTAAGEYNITVNVTGRDFVSGGTVTKSAVTQVLCYSGAQPKPSGNTYTDPMRHFACGQYSESGSGHGWSCGSALGYMVWNGGVGSIRGNPMHNWHEPGIIWTQVDGNGNGVPDETWYEQTGSDETNPNYKKLISRRYAITYFLGSEAISEITDYNQLLRDVYWVDSKGRTGKIPGGWPRKWGVPFHVNSWVTYTGTILRDDGNIGTGSYGGFTQDDWQGYVDAGSTSNYSGWPRIYADGTLYGATTSPSIFTTSVLGSAAYPRAFVKVQTAAFHYGGIFGDVSTEVAGATGLPDQTGGFPIPDY
jgi:hypothetical protein